MKNIINLNRSWIYLIGFIALILFMMLAIARITPLGVWIRYTYDSAYKERVDSALATMDALCKEKVGSDLKGLKSSDLKYCGYADTPYLLECYYKNRNDELVRRTFEMDKTEEMIGFCSTVNRLNNPFLDLFKKQEQPTILLPEFLTVK